VQSFHEELSWILVALGVQTGVHGVPPQQFSVRKAINAFIVEKLAV